MREFPYSFDPVLVWKGNFSQTTDCLDSDRLMQWDYDKFNACCNEVWGNTGQMFYNRSPEEIEIFLRKYLGIALVLTGVEIACNACNGYPYWSFYFKKGEGK